MLRSWHGWIEINFTIFQNITFLFRMLHWEHNLHLNYMDTSRKELQGTENIYHQFNVHNRFTFELEVIIKSLSHYILKQTLSLLWSKSHTHTHLFSKKDYNVNGKMGGMIRWNCVHRFSDVIYAIFKQNCYNFRISALSSQMWWQK